MRGRLERVYRICFVLRLRSWQKSDSKPIVTESRKRLRRCYFRFSSVNNLIFRSLIQVTLLIKRRVDFVISSDDYNWSLQRKADLYFARSQRLLRLRGENALPVSYRARWADQYDEIIINGNKQMICLDTRNVSSTDGQKQKIYLFLLDKHRRFIGETIFCKRVCFLSDVLRSTRRRLTQSLL